LVGTVSETRQDKQWGGWHRIGEFNKNIPNQVLKVIDIG
jgi:hypothetical protein